MQRVKKETLVKKLGRAIRAKVGEVALNTLIYGWLKYRKYGKRYRNVIYNRDWLYASEVQDLSDYAGYDLMTGEKLPDK